MPFSGLVPSVSEDQVRCNGGLGVTHDMCLENGRVTVTSDQGRNLGELAEWLVRELLIAVTGAEPSLSP